MNGIDRNEMILRIQKLLLKSWDPIGISDLGEADDEYDGYVEDVTSLVMNRASREDMFNYLWDAETEHMGLKGDAEHTRDFVQQLVQLQSTI